LKIIELNQVKEKMKTKQVKEEMMDEMKLQQSLIEVRIDPAGFLPLRS